MAPQVRLELTTLRLTAECSAIELLRIIRGLCRGSLPARRSACQLPALLRSALAHAPASHCASVRCPVLPYVLGAGKTFVPPAPLGSRQLPTLPSRSQLSTISVWRLNFCVRYGYRWCPPAIVTGNFPSGRSPSLLVRFASHSSLSLRVLSAWLAPLPAPSKLHRSELTSKLSLFFVSRSRSLALPPLPRPSRSLPLALLPQIKPSTD